MRRMDIYEYNYNITELFAKAVYCIFIGIKI